MESSVFLSVRELLGYSMPITPIVRDNRTKNEGPSSNVSITKSWAKLAELRLLPNFNPLTIRQMIGQEIYDAKTSLTDARIKETYAEAITMTPQIEYEDQFTAFNLQYYTLIINAMLSAVAVKTGTRMLSSWAKHSIKREGRNNYGRKYSPLSADNNIRIVHADCYTICVIGDDKLSAHWMSSLLEDIRNRGHAALNDWKRYNSAPARQVATYAHWTKTRWTIIFTDKEVVFGRAYYCPNTPELQKEIDDFYQHDEEAEEVYLGLEFESIPWVQKPDETHMSPLEGILAFAMMSANEEERKVVPHSEMRPLNLWLDLGNGTWQHNLTGRITTVQPTDAIIHPI
ncbi:hypothetical protein F4778DRAFT_728889 [Xylariomycetidae sp. FL2044]|nr:hypothetical protein F4778DRAFT_728889 [Xylariomycetidae sp. FL2044]